MWTASPIQEVMTLQVPYSQHASWTSEEFIMHVAYMGELVEVGLFTIVIKNMKICVRARERGLQVG